MEHDFQFFKLFDPDLLKVLRSVENLEIVFHRLGCRGRFLLGTETAMHYRLGLLVLRFPGSGVSSLRGIVSRNTWLHGKLCGIVQLERVRGAVVGSVPRFPLENSGLRGSGELRGKLDLS